MINSCKKAYRLVRENYFLLVIPAAFDLIFLFAYGFFTGPIFAKILENIQAYGYFLIQNAGATTQAFIANPSLQGLAASQPTSDFYIKSLIGL